MMKVFISLTDYAVVVDLDKVRLDEVLECLKYQYGSHNMEEVKNG